MQHGFVLIFVGFTHISSSKFISLPLFLLPRETLFMGGLVNGFPCPGDGNAFLTLVTLNFLHKSEQS